MKFETVESEGVKVYISFKFYILSSALLTNKQAVNHHEKLRQNNKSSSIYFQNYKMAECIKRKWLFIRIFIVTYRSELVISSMDYVQA